jgi:hypothetical protein
MAKVIVRKYNSVGPGDSIQKGDQYLYQNDTWVDVPEAFFGLTLIMQEKTTFSKFRRPVRVA